MARRTEINTIYYETNFISIFQNIDSEITKKIQFDSYIYSFKNEEISQLEVNNLKYQYVIERKIKILKKSIKKTNKDLYKMRESESSLMNFLNSINVIRMPSVTMNDDLRFSLTFGNITSESIVILFRKNIDFVVFFKSDNKYKHLSNSGVSIDSLFDSLNEKLYNSFFIKKQ